MTISTTTNRVSYTGNGSTTAFSFPYLFLANSDLVVVETIVATGVQTVKALTTDYTVTGAGVAAGGTVTAVTAPASTVTWTIYRDPALTQAVDLVDNDPLPAASIETPLDKLTMISQRHKDRLDRTLQQHEGDTTAIGRLPAKVARASKFLGFDNNGEPIAAAGTSADLGPVSVFVDTLLDAADAAAFRGTVKGSVITRAANTILGESNIGDAIIASGTWSQTFDDAATLGDGWYVLYRNDGSGVITLSLTASTDLYPGQGCTIVCDGTTLKTVGLDVSFGITGLTEDTSPDPNNDFVETYDASASALKKVKPHNLANFPSAHVYRSGSQNIAASTLTKVQLNAERVDSRNCFDSTTNFRFVSDVPGKIQVIVIGKLAVASAVLCQFAVYKNGVSYEGAPSFASPAANHGTAMAVAVVDVDGSADYLEIFAFHNDVGPQNLTECVATFAYAGK